ncbi:hypothetical protein M153_6500016023 [Pseudoloma neurophilia]|uniref:Uncharacterized protein n=1 Tax=Pseudoloma neurophilia TaxID=146866 RepID=A0A0R0M7I2_9MICR|nr:hypothetical protein M153_6500016023 [Pseudoloma neurophilia]
MLCPTFQYIYLLIQLAHTSDQKEQNFVDDFVNFIFGVPDPRANQTTDEEINIFEELLFNQIQNNDDPRCEKVIQLFNGLKQKIDVYINLHPVLKNDRLVKQFYQHLVAKTVAFVEESFRLHYFFAKSFDEQEKSFNGSSSKDHNPKKLLSRMDNFVYRFLPLWYSIIDSIFSYFFAIYTYEQTEINMKSHVEILENTYPNEFANISQKTYKGVLKIFFENVSQDLKMKVKKIYGQPPKEESPSTNNEKSIMYSFHIESFEQYAQKPEEIKHIYNCKKILELSDTTKQKLISFCPEFYEDVSEWVFNIFFKPRGDFENLWHHKSSRKVCPLCYLSIYIPESDFKRCQGVSSRN